MSWLLINFYTNEWLKFYKNKFSSSFLYLYFYIFCFQNKFLIGTIICLETLCIMSHTLLLPFINYVIQIGNKKALVGVMGAPMAIGDSEGTGASGPSCGVNMNQ